MVKNLLTNDDKYDRIRKSRLKSPKGTRSRIPKGSNEVRNKELPKILKKGQE